MPLISRIGRRHVRTRLLIAGIYLLLCIGGLTMVYPFGLMIAGSTKSEVDRKELQLIPGFLTDDVLLYRKFVQSLHNEDLNLLRMAYDSDAPSFGQVEPPDHVNEKLVDAWLRFLDGLEIPDYAYGLGHQHCRLSHEVHAQHRRAFIRQLKNESDGDLDRVNEKYGTIFVSWQTVDVNAEQYLMRRSTVSDEPIQLRWTRFKQDLGHAHRYYFSIEGYFKSGFLKPQYTRDVESYNAAHGTDHASYDEVRLARRVPDGTDLERRDWLQFVRNTLNLLWIRAGAEAAPAYRGFLEAKYRSIESVNRAYETDFREFESIPMVEQAPLRGIVASDWEAFLQGWVDPDTKALHLLPEDALYVHSLDFQFRDHLRTGFESIDRLNAALDTTFGAFEEIPIPQKEAHYTAFLDMTGALRWEYATRNYRTVVAYTMLHGRAILNTVIYCGLAIITALIVNPMAAYALSRYDLPSAYKVLLFLMLTMAFPQMVNQIPQFLMLREFRMLNTYWALILPGLASGYSIFILKGFFDSQPRELYESASLDGAGEWVLFWQITMNLSKPVLAYIALFAFTGAYSNFMFAMLICQDERMWTLMPMLYQLQQRSSEGIVFASLLIAAIPTFVVFLVAQNVIMRGIVVPVEK
ncbi:MAG: hypothetical protein CMJ18_05605 [Phycisphaeraceae bacterium]|nr:hypothetical protein [Phycisphaeraceae bacterium]